MTLPPELDGSLSSSIDGDAAANPLTDPAPINRVRGPGARAAALRRKARFAARSWARRLMREEIEQLEAVGARQSELDSAATAETTVTGILLRREIEATRINLDLLKAEFRSLLDRVEQLGFALAPTAGLSAAGDRFAELREEVHALERRMRRLDLIVREGGEAAAPAALDAAASAEQQSTREGSVRNAPSAMSELFDYVGFERRFRGDPLVILAEQEDRYADLLAGTGGPVLDVGCGRGELMEVLHKRGVPVFGVDTDAGMVAEAQGRGLDVRLVDALTFLADAQPGSLGAVFAGQVAEHLSFDDLLRLINLSLTALKPGGVLAMETPNPATLVVLGNSFILDPTHTRPIHPALMSFLCESAGYRSVQVRFFSPAEGYHLAPLPSTRPDWAAAIDENSRRLNEVLFGAQDYVVIATTPQPATTSE